MRIFKRKLSKQLKNDKNLQQAIKDGDKQIEDLKKAEKAKKLKDIKSHHMSKILKVRNYKWQRIFKSELREIQKLPTLLIRVWKN